MTQRIDIRALYADSVVVAENMAGAAMYELVRVGHGELVGGRLEEIALDAAESDEGH